MNRKQFLRTGVLAGSFALLAACGGMGGQSRKAPAFIDESLRDGKHPFLEAVNINYNPTDDEGRIELVSRYKRAGEIRLNTEELTKRKRGFYL